MKKYRLRSEDPSPQIVTAWTNGAGVFQSFPLNPAGQIEGEPTTWVNEAEFLAAYEPID